MIRFTSRKTHTNIEIEDAVPETPAPPPMPLVLLAADAASPAARRLHRFPGTDAAAEFIRFWFPPEKRCGLIAFWSLHEAPMDADAEALVVIRDDRDPTLVYPFSFLDLPSAMAFAGHEAARGIDPSLVSIHYAVPVSIKTTQGHDDAISLTPPTPPAWPRPLRAPRPETRWAYRIDTPAVSDAPGLLPEDLVERVLQVLRFRRWGSQANPFAGFGSPPGRF